MAQLTKSFPVSAGIQHREVINDYDIDKEGVGEWTEGGAKSDDEDNGELPTQNGENGEQKMTMADIQVKYYLCANEIFHLGIDVLYILILLKI